MATQAWSTTIGHTTDAEFRAWGSELAGKLSAAGLVQTTDTGQINWATVTRAAANSNAGYEIWRFNDVQQATAPIFIRIDYGTGASATTPRMLITVGTGTNGAGTLTGTALTTARTATTNTAPTSTVTAYSSYLCVNEGFLGLSWKVGSQSSTFAQGGFIIARSSDTSGVPDATAALVMWAPSAVSQSAGVQYLRFAATARAFTFIGGTGNVGTLGHVPGGEAASVVGADIQAFHCWMLTPNMRPLHSLALVYTGEVAVAATFSATMVGTTPRTFINVGTSIGLANAGVVSVTSIGLAMLWE